MEGKESIGYHDQFVADGGAHRVFRPLWWRTYRYLELEIETKGEALTVEDLRATAVGFPFQRKARFETDTPDAARGISRFWMWAGARRAYAPTKLIWTARITSSCSM